MSKVLVVIPARLASKRLPGKVLIKINGKPLIQWVYEGASQSKLADKVIVATDSHEVLDCVREFGGEFILASSEHETGSERVAEVAKKMPDFDIIINVQGDNPFVQGEMIDVLARSLIENSGIQMVALKSRIRSKEELEDPSVIKVITDKKNFAIAYSRSIIPYNRDNSNVVYYRNKGIYGFKRDFLLKFVKLPQGPLEMVESLEQLRALEHGYKIYVAETDIETFEVNVPKDVQIVKEKLKERDKQTVKNEK